MIDVGSTTPEQEVLEGTRGASHEEKSVSSARLRSLLQFLLDLLPWIPCDRTGTRRPNKLSPPKAASVAMMFITAKESKL